MLLYVVGFMFSPDRNQVLLIEKQHPEYQKGKLNGIGGKVELTDGSIFDTMVREFEEETGVQTIYNDWSQTCNLIGNDFRVYFFESFSDKYKGAYSKTDEKVFLVPINRLPYKNLMPNLKIIIPLALDETGLVKPVILSEI